MVQRFRTSIGLPAPAVRDHGAAITALWRPAVGPPLSEDCTWQLRRLWTAFKPVRTDARGRPVYTPPPPDYPAAAMLPAERQYVTLAAGDRSARAGLIESLLEAAETAALAAAYRRALVLERRARSW
jgi:hypothetical protein